MRVFLGALRPSLPSSQEIETFIRQSIRDAKTSRQIGLVLLSFSALFAFAILWWFFYMLTLLIGRQALTHADRLGLAAGLILLICVAYRWADQKDLSEIKVDTLDGKPAYSITLPGGTLLSNVNWVSPKTLQSLARLVLQLVFIAPQCVAGLFQRIRQIRALSTVEIGSCAAVFGQLLQRNRRVPFLELEKVAGLRPASVFADLIANLPQDCSSSPPLGRKSSAARPATELNFEGPGH